MHPIVNLDQLDYDTPDRPAAFAARLAPVAARIDARQLGYRVTELAPGARAWPFHSHFANEEMFFVLEGTGVLRMGSQRLPIRSGDFIAAPTGGAESAHQIINTSDQVLRYLCVSTMIEPEVALYPDSGKFGALVGAAPGGNATLRRLHHFGHLRDAADYWEGEGAA